MKCDLYYDATFKIVTPHRGMAKYLNGFIEALQLSGIENLIGIAPSGLNAKGAKNIISFGFQNILLWEQLSLNRFIKENNVQYFIFPYNTGPFFSSKDCTTVLFLHDLIFMEPFSKIPLSKNFRQIVGRFYRRIVAPNMIKSVDHIITVSRYSKSEIQRRYCIEESKITVIPNFIDSKQMSPQGKRKDKRRFFLNVGGDAPHKNTLFLIKGYADLPADIKSKYSLKIVGISNSSNKKRLGKLIKSLKEENNIEIEHFLDDQQLKTLYEGAFLFIFPSLTEGFGIPLLEAMQSGCAIACSSSSVMPEVCGDAAFYFDPHDSESFAGAVCSACYNDELRNMKEFKAVERLNYYSRASFNEKVDKWFNEHVKNGSTGKIGS